MTLNPKVCFIIVSWNNEKLIKECLDSIKSQTYKNYSTIMVDNGSKDNSVAEAIKAMPQIYVMETGINNGFTKGNNIGIQEALKDLDIEYIALLNTDARLTNKWLEEIIKFAQKKPKGAFFQGTILRYNEKNIIDSTHIFVNHRGQAVQANWKKPYITEIGPKKVFGVNAAACVISRKFIEAQPFKRLFDETMFMYLEDVDLAARSTVMGWDNYLVPKARAYHIGSASSANENQISSFAIYMTYRNNLGVILKNFSWKIILRILIKIPRTDYQTIRHLIKIGEKTAAKNAVKGRLISLLRLPLYIYLRTKLRRYRTIDTSHLWSLMEKGY